MKKRIIPILIFLLMTITSFMMLYTSKSFEEKTKFKNLESHLQSFNITISTNYSSANTIYDLVTHYVSKHKGNIFYNEESKKDESYTNYVYFTDNSIFKDINLESGKVLEPYNDNSNLFLGTKKSEDKNQIGQIESFSGKDEFIIKPMKSNLDISTFSREFTLQLKDEDTLNNLTSDLEKEGVYIRRSLDGESGKYNNNLIIIVLCVCFIVLTLFMFYGVFNSYRKIGIEKLLGHSLISIWKEYSMPIIIIELAIIIISTICLSLIKFESFGRLYFEFLFQLIAIYLLIIIFTIVALSIPYIYVKNISLSNIIKNKKPVKGIITFYNIIKVIITTVVIVLSVFAINNLNLINARYKSSYLEWEKTKNYVVMPDFATTDEKLHAFSKSEIEKERELYLHFNKKGGVLADFNSYDPSNVEESLKDIQEEYMMGSVRVNPNYLKENTIYDVDGNAINIDESVNDAILLVPQKYKDFESEILDYYNTTSHEPCDVENCNHKTVDGKVQLKDQKQKIIWTKSNQKYFSYRLDINPREGNFVIDPIISVLTESNDKLSSYYTIIGFRHNPFKIKVKDVDNAKNEVLSKVSEYYDMNLYRFPVENLYNVVQSQISNIKNRLILTSLIIIVLITIVLLIITQNISLYFNGNKFKITIQKLHGYKFIHKYFKYFISVIITWAFVIPISSIITKDLKVLLLSGLLMIFEIIIIIFMIISLERKNIVRFTKER
ncbi:DUF1430 domain-containing protein [Clostridium chrysemydis]|uniref:DUF1430 domain-containing protein n=1 Tax=Clostridium chrysemydis TaxID=2665504 RepID=UPI0018848551|nr:DUF1430 domain-containing protein [Clostridium chrysemydis]